MWHQLWTGYKVYRAATGIENLHRKGELKSTAIAVVVVSLVLGILLLMFIFGPFIYYMFFA